ncbi:helicase-related protein [Insolitispirillum peregrinum]|uniref:helicase-related protein n=1 Tax=Insolitispirillum peregrinum TaxID=80876 RepID=UPI00360765EF
MSLSEYSQITAVLGPTNTGKTHLAIERMLGYASGMIGFPLRLLARENYDRIVRLKGPAHVALITGEERIIPLHPRWYVCTVEAMPLQRSVEFLAIDEIQLAADPDRGHVFTDRLLHARGRSETMFLGAETMKPLIRQLIPDVEIITRPRLSQLTYSGPRKLTRLPRRSAVVAFSAQDVYSIAELIRRTRGGTAVVLGALSPRTRNAQVAMFQAGEVEHLVATDAIGMGLNMDIDHVAFAALRKFDGRAPRDLSAAEVAQIGGRAGRHLNDGTFGTTGDVGGIDADIIEQVESHQFPPLQGIFWRNRDLRFTSIEALLGSLGKAPQTPGLIRTRPADDQLVLEALAREPDIAQSARGLGQLKLLWEVCQIPDFRKVQPETHARLLGQIFRHLASHGRRLPTDWLAGHLAGLDRADGDMHALMDRIASIRIWTYVSQRADWILDAAHWQERTRAIEDMLSDALHDRLTQRFVDVRTSVLAKSLKQGGPLLAAISGNDSVSVEGQYLGRLDGLTFVPDASDSHSGNRAVLNAASKALRGEISRRIGILRQDGLDAFTLADDGEILWRGSVVARLVPGPTPLRPQIEVPADDLLDSDNRTLVRRHLEGWLKEQLARTLKPLIEPWPERLSGPARGMLYQLAEAFGALPVTQVHAQSSSLSKSDRDLLAHLGVKIGAEMVFAPRLYKPAAQHLSGILWCVARGTPVPAVQPNGRVTLPVGTVLPPELAKVWGYRAIGDRWVRLDALETVIAAIRQRNRDKATTLGNAELGQLLSPLGLPAAMAPAVFATLGYQLDKADDGTWTYAPAVRQRTERPRRGPPPPPRPPAPVTEAETPFAVLRSLIPPPAPPPAPARKRHRPRKAKPEPQES